MAVAKKDEVLNELLGKTISGVVFANASGQPKSQIFLTFSDGSSFELYTNEEIIFPCKGLGKHSVDDIKKIVERRTHASCTVYRPSYEDPNSAQSDLLSGA